MKRTIETENGNPTIYKSDDIDVIVDVSSAGHSTVGNDLANATEIPRISKTTIVRVNQTAADSGVALPSNAEIGDVVEVYWFTGTFGNHWIYAPSGELYHSQAQSKGQGATGAGFVARKISASVWGYIA